MNWLYKEREVSNISQVPEGTFGFVYEVTHLPTGKKYIGKKVFYFERSKRLSQKQVALLKEERAAQGIKGRCPSKVVERKESDWLTYAGSQKEIKDLLKQGSLSDFKREILMFVPTKKLLTYFETKYQMIYQVLENDEYLNSNVSGKFYPKDFDILK